MSHPNLPSLRHSAFPQVLEGALDLLVRRIAQKPELSLCGACGSLATVHDLDTHQELCTACFLEVCRGE